MSKPKWTAIFDLDGTLIPHTSAEKTFFFYLLRNKTFSVNNIFQMITAVWSAHGNLHDMTRTNKRYLKYKRSDEFEAVARKYFEPRIELLVFPTMQRIIDEHKNNGDLLLLLTGTLDVIAKCFVRSLKLDGYRATTLEVDSGRYTGRVVGIQPYGVGKLEVLRELKKQYHFDQGKTTLYANAYSDRYVMNAIEKPIAVNPEKKLRIYAARSQWQIIDPK